MYWKHPTHRSGQMSYGRRRYAAIRSDGVFEAPDDAALSERLAASGCVPIDEPPSLDESTAREPAKSAKQIRIEKRIKRREREGTAAVEPSEPPAAPEKGDDDGDEWKDLSGHTIPELREIAEEHGVDLGDATKKADILAAIYGQAEE